MHVEFVCLKAHTYFSSLISNPPELPTTFQFEFRGINTFITVYKCRRRRVTFIHVLRIDYGIPRNIRISVSNAASLLAEAPFPLYSLS